MDDKTHYEILGVLPDASHRRIRKAFMKLAEEYQHDRRKFPAAGWYFDRLKKAYDTLSDYDARCRYNAALGLPEPSGPEDGNDEGFLVDMDNAFPQWPVALPLAFFGILTALSAIVWRSWGDGSPLPPFFP